MWRESSAAPRQRGEREAAEDTMSSSVWSVRDLVFARPTQAIGLGFLDWTIIWSMRMTIVGLNEIYTLVAGSMAVDKRQSLEAC